MAKEHHDLDIHPIPKEKTPLYINEPWLIDRHIFDYGDWNKEPDSANDNIRIYVPLDLNKEAILRRLDYIIMDYGEATEENEMNFAAAVRQLVNQVEIYDQIWFVRHFSKESKHSREAIELMRAFVQKLKDIPDGCAELFPFELIEELEAEYLR